MNWQRLPNRTLSRSNIIEQTKQSLYRLATSAQVTRPKFSSIYSRVLNFIGEQINDQASNIFDGRYIHWLAFDRQISAIAIRLLILIERVRTSESCEEEAEKKRINKILPLLCVFTGKYVRFLPNSFSIEKMTTNHKISWQMLLIYNSHIWVCVYNNVEVGHVYEILLFFFFVFRVFRVVKYRLTSVKCSLNSTINKYINLTSTKFAYMNIVYMGGSDDMICWLLISNPTNMLQLINAAHIMKKVFKC